MVDQLLPIGTPSSQGTDARGILALLDAVESAPDIEMHSLMALRHGVVIAQGWWAPYTPAHRQQLYSLSKSFTGSAVGLAAAEGLLRLDDPLVSYFPEFEADITDPRSRSILVRHAASMASGHLTEQWFTALETDDDEPVRGFLLNPPEREPGTVFAYNQACSFSLSAIVQRVTGMTVTEYLRPRLLDPLGIGEVGWHRHRSGRDLGYSGLHATTDAVARLGLLYLNGGVWNGERVLSAEWAAEATRPHVANANGNADSDWEQGYCFQFWKSRHGYRGDGAHGQYCVVLPEHDAVIAITAETRDMQKVLDLLWEHLLPAFDRVSGGDVDAELERRLAGLMLPPTAGEPAPSDALWDEGTWDGATFTAADPEGAPRSLTGVRLAREDGRWVVTLDEDGSPLALPLTPGGWHTEDGGEATPAAISGGWTGAGTFAADIVLLETPHRLSLTCDLADHTFRSRWHTPPLVGSDSFAVLRCPERS